MPLPYHFSKKAFCIFAYKPRSDDYCRGCHMASYDSKYVDDTNVDIAGLTASLTQIFTENEKLKINEAGFGAPSILICDNPDWEEWKFAYRLLDSSTEEYHALVNPIANKAAKLVQEAKEREENEKRLEAEKRQREQDQREFERLRQKLGK